MEKPKILPTGIKITYRKNGNIKTCKSYYDGYPSSYPLSDKKDLKVRSSYVPLLTKDINKWFSSFRTIGIHKNT